ncbi:hypothetical protein V1517DRAFT_326022 [Lipomyces orientalis]|uniref:Uncharacterized protein n=1 Tax=Lipomyces orientalis TaxID=1233043 RepID=A0ACC3TLN9_9ASCO
MTVPLPVIVCGKSTTIANSVITALKPEYEVIHVILSPAQGVAQIPGLLLGKNPGELDNIGTRNYSQKAIALVTGAGYDDDAIAEMRGAAKGTTSVPWLRPDMNRPAPPLGPGYGEALVIRVKETLKQLAAEGKLQEDALVYY